MGLPVRIIGGVSEARSTCSCWRYPRVFQSLPGRGLWPGFQSSERLPVVTYPDKARPMRLTSDRSSADASGPQLPVLKLRELEGLLREGDVVFTRIPHAPFTQIADATGTWTNHVGIVVGFSRFGAVIAESRVPLSCRTLFSFFARRSAQGRVAVLRPHRALSEA